MPDGDSSLCMPGASVVCLVTETAFGDRGFKTQSGWLGTRRREAFERGTPDGASLIYIYYVSVSCATVGDAHMSIRFISSSWDCVSGFHFENCSESVIG